MAIKLQLERHSGRYTDILDAGNSMEISDWPYLHWLCSNGENRHGLLPLFNGMTNGRKLQLERQSRRHTGLLDAGNPMVTSDWPYLRWFCGYGDNLPRFPWGFTQRRMAIKVQRERHSRRYIDILDAGNSMVTSDWPYLRWLCSNSANFCLF